MPVLLGSKEQEAKQQLEEMLEKRIKETLRSFCIENLFSGFGMATPVLAAFGIDVQKFMIDGLKELVTEFENEQITDED